MRERDIEAYLVKRVKEHGGEIRKTQFEGHPGAPDRFVMLPHKARGFWVELKATGVAAKPHQIREHNRMRRLGELVELVDSIEGVDALLA